MGAHYRPTMDTYYFQLTCAVVEHFVVFFPPMFCLSVHCSLLCFESRKDSFSKNIEVIHFTLAPLETQDSFIISSLSSS